MLTRSLILLLALGIWVAGLQFTARPAVSAVPLILAMAIHVVPPLALWMGWLAMHWRASEQRHREAERRAAEEAARREAERAAARRRHEEELQQRRFHCECRALAISAVQMQALPLADALPPNAEIVVLDDAAPRRSPPLQRLRPAIASVLGFLYSTSPAAVQLPVYIAPPADIPGNHVLELVRSVRAELAESVGVPLGHAAPVLFLPAAGNAANSVLALFDNAPDLPGATVLAFDSPLARSHADEDEDEAQARRYPHQYPDGLPNEGAVALLVTNTELARMLEAASGFEPVSLDGDAMMPFWERTTAPEGISPLLVRMDRVLRTELGSLPSLGRIHRASLGEATNERGGILEMTRLLQGLLEYAQVDAGLLDKPFTLDDAGGMNTEEALSRQQCSALVHNAGNAGTGGKRLAALGSAMLYSGIDFSPVDPEATTNILTSLGDLGCASGMAQLALCLVHAAASEKPALCAEFTSRSSVAISIAMPPAVSARLQQET